MVALSTAKMTNSEKVIYFLRLMPCSVSKVLHVIHMYSAVYSETCLNRSCSKAETLLRRTDTFDPASFLYAFLSRISKAKNCKEDTASDG